MAIPPPTQLDYLICRQIGCARVRASPRRSFTLLMVLQGHNQQAID